MATRNAADGLYSIARGSFETDTHRRHAAGFIHSIIWYLCEA